MPSPAAVHAAVARLRRGGRRRFDLWQVGSLLVAVLVSLPLLAILWLALFPSENIWPHLISTSLPRYLGNTVILMLGVGILVFLIGVSTAYLVSQFEFSGRRWFEWLLLLPFTVPAYVMAYVYTDLLEFAGPVQSGLRRWFGWQLAGDYWFPNIRSIGGAILFMALVLYPYVYMMARVSFLAQSSHLCDVSRLMGRSSLGCFLHVSLPIARPAIAVGVCLALMETLNDFGTVDFFAIHSLTTGLYDVWLNMGNPGGAAQIAAVMLLFVLFLLGAEYAGRRKQRFYQTSGRFKHRPRPALRRGANWAAVAVCGLPVTAGFFIPCGLLLRHAVAHFESSWSVEFAGRIANSLWVSAAAAGLCVLLALMLTYCRRLHPRSGFRAAVKIASLGYAVPGAVLAVGVIIPFAALDNALDGFARRQFGFSTGLLLSGTTAAVIFAYTVRFLAISTGALNAGFSKISESVDMSARTLGHTAMQTLRRFHFPLLKGSVLTAALIVFVDCMKELPATLILRPFNFETLATHVYHFASDEMIEQSALGALLIVLSGLLPIIILSKTISASQMLDTGRAA